MYRCILVYYKIAINATKELQKKQSEAHEQLKAEVYLIKEELEKQTKANEDTVLSVESGHTKEVITQSKEHLQELRQKGDPGNSVYN